VLDTFVGGRVWAQKLHLGWTRQSVSGEVKGRWYQGFKESLQVGGYNDSDDIKGDNDSGAVAETEPKHQGP
jgi:hypothetical protein